MLSPLHRLHMTPALGLECDWVPGSKGGVPPFERGRGHSIVVDSIGVGLLEPSDHLNCIGSAAVDRRLPVSTGVPGSTQNELKTVAIWATALTKDCIPISHALLRHENQP